MDKTAGLTGPHANVQLMIIHDVFPSNRIGRQKRKANKIRAFRLEGAASLIF